MKFEIEKIKIEMILQKATRLTGKHLTLPVLSCVYFDFKNEDLVVKSTNLDLGLEFKTKIKSTSHGSFVVPAVVLLNTISGIRDEKINFEVVDNNLKITTLKNKALIKCMSKEDFPSIPAIENTNSIKIPINDLLLGFKSVWYSASNSTIKPELSSVYVYKNNDYLTFVSTDSFRLAEKSLHIKFNSDFPPILIPYKNVTEIIRIIDGLDGEIEILFDKNQIAFRYKDLYLVSRLIDGSFPDYKQIIPKEPTTTLILLKSEVINAVKSSVVFSDSLNQIKLKVDSKNKTLTVDSKNNDVGEYTESIKANIEGDDIELNFNNKYLSDCFQSIFSDSLSMKFNGLGKPLIISGANDNSFAYVLMPMNR